MVAATQTLDEELAKLKAERLDKYVKSVWDAVAGKPLKAADIESTCVAAGRTIEQWQSLFERCKARKEAATKLVEADKAAAAALRAGEKIAPLNVAIDELTREYERRHREMMSERSQAISDSTTHSTREKNLREEAWSTLRDTAADPKADKTTIRDLHFVAVDRPEDVPLGAPAPTIVPHYGPTDYPMRPLPTASED